MSEEAKVEEAVGGNQESTSSVSLISYEIEKWLDLGYSEETIIGLINKLKQEGKFPENLVYIDSYFGEVTGLSGCAFFDTNTNQTIAGFAGTNGENGTLRYLQDIVQTDLLALGALGFEEGSLGHLYIMEAQNFIENLENQGYSIDIVTGHSLGGAQASAIGRKYNIPLIVTYNAAATENGVSNDGYGELFKILLAALNMGGTSEEYTGTEIRFVTDNDFLNIGMTILAGDYKGERITIPSGTGHDMRYFVNSPLVQEIIIGKLEEVYGYNKSDLFAVDFDDDGLADVYKDQSQLFVKNLFNVMGDTYGQGSNIKITPEVMRTLSRNITKMSIDDIDWIRNAVVLCEGKNEEISGLKDGREDTLYSEVAEGLNDASLNQLLVAMNESHGELLKSDKKAMLSVVENIDCFFIMTKMEMDNYLKTWYLDGRVWSANERTDFVSKIDKAKKSANKLLKLLEEESFSKDYTFTVDEYNAPYYSGGVVRGEYTYTYSYESLSDIVNGYVEVTNGFISESKEVFEGRGIRSGKQDGIVEAIKEVIEVEKKNVEEIKLSLERLSEMATGIADNFESADEYLASVINGGSGSLEIKEVAGSYEAYLEEHEVFDDVKDVLEAFDLQIEEASEILMNKVIDRYSLLLEPTRKRFEDFVYELDQFGLIVNEVSKIMELSIRTEQRVISREYNTDISDFVEVTTIKNEYLGTLGSFCGNEIVRALDYIKANILPLKDIFFGVVGFTALFGSNITYLQEYFRTTIERAVYNTMELDEIVDSHKMVSGMLTRMERELSAVIEQIEKDSVGATVEMYAEAIGKSKKEMEYLRMMIDDCFGDNGGGVQQTAQTITTGREKYRFSKSISRERNKLS